VHDARPSLIIFAVLSVVLRSGFRDTRHYLLCLVKLFVVCFFYIAAIWRIKLYIINPVNQLQQQVTVTPVIRCKSKKVSDRTRSAI